MATMPTPEQIQQFLAGPADQPVVMLNLLKFKERADASHPGMSGRDAVMLYSTAMREFVERSGGTFVVAADIDSQVMGVGGDFDFIAVMRYPSRQRFLELAADPEITRTIMPHRDAGLESQWLFAMTEVAA